MNFELKHGLIWITFELIYKGNSVVIDNCIVDTGSAATYISNTQVRLWQNYLIKPYLQVYSGVITVC